MKFKVYVLDLEIPRRTKRIALLLGIPTALLFGVVAVAYAGGLVTFSSGEVISATTMNANFAYLQSEIATLQATTCCSAASGSGTGGSSSAGSGDGGSPGH